MEEEEEMDLTKTDDKIRQSETTHTLQFKLLQSYYIGGKMRGVAEIHVLV